MRFSAASFTEAGPRPRNEDAIGVWQLPDERLAVAVADGLGGHFGGAVASNLAIRQFGSAILHNFEQSLHDLVREIHEELRIEQSKNSTLRDMATTFSAAVFTDDLMKYVHCGDSRIAVARGDGVKRLTTDHSEAQRLLASGKLTAEQYASYPRRNILESALGIAKEPVIDTASFHVHRGDKFFFTTDGLHNKILLREMLGLSKSVFNPSQFAERIHSEMISRHANDNYSLVCVFAQ